MSISSLLGYPAERERIVVGLMSGTSADGIDAAAVLFPPLGACSGLKVLGTYFEPYPDEIREQVLLAAADKLSLRRAAVLSTKIGELFARAALAAIPRAGCDLLASHGQTVAHLPLERATLQLGDASIIAARTGIVTIADFRPADMAWGGQGAPLVPAFDAYLLQDANVRRIAVNLGGIANITLIPRSSSEEILAWDTGPANCVSDALCRLSGLGNFDADGEIASSGRVDEALLSELSAHPYFSKPAPKSTGLEDFGQLYAERILRRAKLSDLLRTVVALSARTLVSDLQAIAGRLGERQIELVFAGGGTSNKTLMREIENRLHQGAREVSWSLRSFKDFGVADEAREAVAFAYLGDRTALGLTGSLPAVTGASRAAILGRVNFPPPSKPDGGR